MLILTIHSIHNKTLFIEEACVSVYPQPNQPANFIWINHAYWSSFFLFFFRSLRLSLLSLLLAYFSSVYLTSLYYYVFPVYIALTAASTFCHFFINCFFGLTPKNNRLWTFLLSLHSYCTCTQPSPMQYIFAPGKIGKLEKSSVPLPFLGV